MEADRLIEARRDTIKGATEEMFGNTERPEMVQVHWYCLASLIYHKQYLLKNLPKESRIMSTCLFRHTGVDDILRISKLVITTFPWDNKFCITLTGITPTVSMFNNHRQQAEQISLLPDKIEKILSKILDDRNLGGAAFSTTQLQNLLNNAVKAMVDPIRETLTNLSNDFKQLKKRRVMVKILRTMMTRILMLMKMLLQILPLVSPKSPPLIYLWALVGQN
jgi:hypothetical protein